jgi:Fe-S cluster assembly ATP-binding protein
MFEIKNLHVSVGNRAILKGVNLRAKPGEIHAIMGRNGTGKSTLVKAIGGHLSYKPSEGEVLLQGENLLLLDVDKRAQKGLFIGFQYPIEIEGISNEDFLFAMLNERRKNLQISPISKKEFSSLLEEKLSFLHMDNEFLHRGLNSGFSGGEKKKNEILQMALFDPKVAILDETDSGLDIDALKIVANGIQRCMNKEKVIILITHYQRMLDYIKPHFVHIFDEGKIVKTGDADLARQLEEMGYEGI